MLTRDRLRRGAAELAVVVAGVLIAPSADRWVQALDDRDREGTQFEWIAQDVQNDFEMLEGAIERERSRADGAVHLLKAAEDRACRPTAEGADSLVRAFISSAWGLPPNFASSTWSEMVASGDLSLIRDAERRRLSGYYFCHDRIRSGSSARIRMNEYSVMRDFIGELIESIRNAS